MQKNRVFGTWFKELCSLVFVQSMQAMLLMIALSVVVKLYVQADNDAAKAPMGVYCVLILAMIPKVELLVKKIFGLGSGVMNDSMMGGKQSLMKNMIAYKLGSKLLDNGGKIISGAAGLIGGKGGSGGAKTTSRLADNNKKALGTAGSASANSRSAQLNQIAQAIQNATETPEEARKRNRSESLRKLTGGVAETMGAIGGASLGAVFSLGTGGDDLVSNMISGAGVGDMIGGSINNMGYNAASTISSIPGAVKQGVEAIKEDPVRKTVNSVKTKVTRNTTTNNATTGNNTGKTATNKKANNSTKDLSPEARREYQKAMRAKMNNDMDSYKKHREKTVKIMKNERTAMKEGRHSDKSIGEKLNKLNNIDNI